MCAQLAQEKTLKLATVRHFVLDECDKMLEKVGGRQGASGACLYQFLQRVVQCDVGWATAHGWAHIYHSADCLFAFRSALQLDMRSDVQDIFKLTPHDKQVMMFSATLAADMRTICKKFMTNVRSARPTAVSTRATDCIPGAVSQRLASSVSGCSARAAWGVLAICPVPRLLGLPAR